jgi:integrase
VSQAGSIRKRGATFTAYWFVSVNGKRVQRSKGGHRTKGDARTYLTTRLGEIQAGTYTEPTDRKITVKAFLVDHWLPAVRSTQTKGGTPRRESTINAYEVSVGWITPHIGDDLLVNLTPDHVARWLQTLAETGARGGKPLSGRSRQVAYTHLRAAYDFAMARGYVQRNPVALVGRPGAKHREMACWSAAEAQRFLVAAAADRLYAAWVIFLARGLRRGELAGLRWDIVDLDAGRLRITRTRVVVNGKVMDSTPKTAAGRRNVPLDPGLVEVLRNHRKRQLEERLAWGGSWADTGHLFVREDGRPLSPESISQKFERLCKRTGVPVIRLHDLRHTAATLMLEDGTPVKVAAEMLGHSNPAITQSIYQHVLPGMTESAGERLSGRLLGGEL